MTGHLKIIIFMAKENINGKTAVFTLETGSITKWRAMGSASGQMAGSIRGSILMIKSMDMVFLSGLMGGSIMASGVKASRMERAFMLRMARRKRAFGTWGKG